jgi:hypothetical protein
MGSKIFNNNNNIINSSKLCDINAFFHSLFLVYILAIKYVHIIIFLLFEM